MIILVNRYGDSGKPDLIFGISGDVQIRRQRQQRSQLRLASCVTGSSQTPSLVSLIPACLGQPVHFINATALVAWLSESAGE